MNENSPQNATDKKRIDTKTIDTIRAIALDSINKAQSGHTGTAMSLAPLAYVLFTKIMNYNPDNPQWINRDRFILSGGHVSILQYAMLYLTGYDVSLEDLKNFRQLGSKTPGHPEVGHTEGIEYTTGPLGQGFANGVGCAIAEKHLNATFEDDLIDHYTYVTCGDGDMQEGITHEAASLAAHLGLGKLIVFYDDNHITIDGPTELSMSENVGMRFEAYGWHVQDIGEQAENLDAIENAIQNAQQEKTKPSLIIIRSHIAYPSKKFLDTPAGHGAILDDEEIISVKETMGLSTTPFDYDETIVDHVREQVEKRKEKSVKWQQNYSNLKQDGSKTLKEFEQAINQSLSKPYQPIEYMTGDSLATRVAIKNSLQAALQCTNSIMAGSADLTGNTGVDLGQSTSFHEDPKSDQIYFGIREHAQGAIANGIAGHSLLPIVGTFFVFSDYSKPAIRLSALSGFKVGYVFSHDSIGVGEDGPTHQPVEQLAALRAIPNLTVWRPADAREVDAAFKYFLEEAQGPNVFVLSRQNVPILKETEFLPENNEAIKKGAYIISESDQKPQLTIAATGSEVSLALEVKKLLSQDQIECNVVSMPSWEKFREQNEEYMVEVLPQDIPTVGIEAGALLGWSQFVNAQFGITTFGTSAPANQAFEDFGLTAENISNTIKEIFNFSE